MKRYVRQVKFSKDPLKAILHYSWLYNSLRSRKKITAVTCSMISVLCDYPFKLAVCNIFFVIFGFRIAIFNRFYLS